MEHGDVWAAISAITLAGSVVVGWVWTVASHNAKAHTSALQATGDAIVAAKKEIQDKADLNGGHEAEISKVRNDLQAWKDDAHDRFVPKDGLNEFRTGFTHIENELHELRKLLNAVLLGPGC